jgi:hypothetical protein
MKKIFIFLLSILLVLTITINLKERNTEKDVKERKITTTFNEEVEKTYEDNERKETKEIKEESREIIDDKEEVKTSKSIEENNNEHAVQTKETVKEQKTKESTTKKSGTEKKNETTKPEPTQSKEETRKEVESGTVDSSGNLVKEEQVKTVVKEPWEKLGISKEEYENKPMYSWMRVDYSVSSCGSVQNCESQCMTDSEELSYTENVSCIEVYSHSGKYLGEMLKRN